MAQLPITTIVPFNDVNELPACAAACGHLYDANGACVPPAAPTNQPSIYTACFCHDPRVAPFSTTTAGVCDDACTADPNGLNSITAWFKSICSVSSTPAAGNNPTPSSVSGSLVPGSTATSLPVKNLGPGGDWISNHWKWVIMLVILVVGIAGIWIGACIWRRRYVRKRDRKLAAAGSTTTPISWAPALADSSSAGLPPNPTASGDFTSSEKPRTSRKWFRS